MIRSGSFFGIFGSSALVTIKRRFHDPVLYRLGQRVIANDPRVVHPTWSRGVAEKSSHSESPLGKDAIDSQQRLAPLRGPHHERDAPRH